MTMPSGRPPARQALGPFGLRCLVLPVPPALGEDETQVDGAILGGGGDRRKVERWAGLPQRRIQLAEAVRQDEANAGKEGQSDGFGNECGV